MPPATFRCLRSRRCAYVYRVDPVEDLKRQLAAELVRAIDGWTPGQLIYRMRIDQPRISDLRRGRLDRISIARLIGWLDAMGRDVRVVVERRRVSR